MIVKKSQKSDLESQSDSSNERSPFLDFIHQRIFCQGHPQGVTELSKNGDIAGGAEISTDGVQVLVVFQLQTDNDLVTEMIKLKEKILKSIFLKKNCILILI